MKQYIFILINVLFFCCIQSMTGQSIRRSTLCSVGTKHVNVAGNKVASTLGGKSLVCGTAFDGTTYIRQGFQQPNDINQIMIPCFGSAFEVEILETPCGTYFNFEYVGDANAPAANFNWDFGIDAFPETSTQQNPEGVSYLSTGTKTIVLEVSQDTCFEAVSLTFDVAATAFGVNPIVTPILCRGTNLGAIELEIGGGTAPFTVAWSDGSTAASREDLDAGEYAYIVTDAVGCEAFNTILLEAGGDSLSVTSSITLPQDTTSENGAIEIEVAGGEAPYTYNWSNGAITANLTDIKSGLYNLTVTDANDCENEFVFKVGSFMAAGQGTVINDVFTPNGDNINDTWMIRGIENFPDNELQIYNRWGDIVYQVSSYNSEWRGENNGGEQLPSGPYWYIIQLNNEEDTVWSGSVTIIR